MHREGNQRRGAPRDRRFSGRARCRCCCAGRRPDRRWSCRPHGSTCPPGRRSTSDRRRRTAPSAASSTASAKKKGNFSLSVSFRVSFTVITRGSTEWGSTVGVHGGGPRWGSTRKESTEWGSTEGVHGGGPRRGPWNGSPQTGPRNGDPRNGGPENGGAGVPWHGRWPPFRR